MVARRARKERREKAKVDIKVTKDFRKVTEKVLAKVEKPRDMERLVRTTDQFSAAAYSKGMIRPPCTRFFQGYTPIAKPIRTSNPVQRSVAFD